MIIPTFHSVNLLCQAHASIEMKEEKHLEVEKGNINFPMLPFSI